MIAPGTLIGGRYRVAHLLGEGAMGSVYEATFESIGRRVAVKVLHERYARKRDAVARFTQEARAAGSVAHDHIVQVFDLGTHEGIPFIAMEYLEGESLAEALAVAESIDPTRAVHLVGEVLSALASAHAAGIVHRDLKPENVFLERRVGRGECIKLLDFGISKIITAEASEHRVTREGMVLGTPAYMSPEQWTSQPDVDHRADLFAVGVLLYQLLTGGLPYEGDTQAELFVEIVQRTEPPPPPSEIAPGIPPALDPIVLRALNRRREDRYPSAQAFLDALRPFGAADIEVTDAPPVPADSRTIASQTRRATRVAAHATVAARSRRRSNAWLAVGAFSLTLAGALGIAAWSRNHASIERPSIQPIAAESRPVLPATPALRDVRIDLVGLPADASVLLDGVAVSTPTFRVERGDTARQVEIRDGAAIHRLTIVPDRDRSIVIEAMAQPVVADAGVSAAVRRESERRNEHPRSNRGLRVLDPMREF